MCIRDRDVATTPALKDVNSQYTIQEYKYLLDDYQRNGLKHIPSKTDPNDPAYYLKYVHNMPPLEAYKLHTPVMDVVSTEANT